MSLEELVALSPPAADGNPFHLDPRPLMRLLALETSPGRESRLGLLFHKAVAQGALKGARRMREATGIKDIALSGGVFQNLLLRELLVPALVRDGFSVFLNRRVSPGDEGIALGQLFFQA